MAWRGQNVWTVVAVLRALPALARQLVLRLAYLDAPADVSQWVAKSAAGAPPRPPCTMREGASHFARCGLFFLPSFLFQSVYCAVSWCVSPGVRSDCAHRERERERGGGEREHARGTREYERDEIVTIFSGIGVFYWSTCLGHEKSQKRERVPRENHFFLRATTAGGVGLSWRSDESTPCADKLVVALEKMRSVHLLTQQQVPFSPSYSSAGCSFVGAPGARFLDACAAACTCKGYAGSGPAQRAVGGQLSGAGWQGLVSA